MNQVIIDVRTALLESIFDIANARTVVSWLIAAEGRRPIVLVGAGFSRNAKHKDRGDYARPEEVPLWSDVTEKMATHLSVRRDRYDGPTTAELYASSFGEGDLRDLLRSTLADEALAPGRSHVALASYDAAAVITTNCLDTLLDKAKSAAGGNWNRVVVDSDLSASTKKHTSSVDLIYVHGHRSSPDTWVMTRAQYETVAQTRPVIVARVRQLLAQHPCVTVGFGLGDPNFHNVYRQLGKEMRQHQPLGLAIQLGEVSESEKRHWESLGIRIAVPRDFKRLLGNAEAADEFFETFFRHASPSWSPDEKHVRSYVLETHEAELRCARFRDLFIHGWTWSDEIEYHERQERAFALWLDLAFGLLSPEEQAEADRAADEAARQEFTAIHDIAAAGAAAAPSAKATRSEATHFRVLPSWAAPPFGDRLSWRLDALVDRLRSPRAQEALSRHFELALSNDLFETQRAEIARLPWMPLTLWLAARVSDPASGALRALASECHSRAAKYGDAAGTQLIATMCMDLAIDIATASDAVLAKTGGPHPAERLAFLAMLDGTWSLALDNYRQAADGACRGSAYFKEWVWRQGELSALLAWASRPGSSGVVNAQVVAEALDRERLCRNRIRVLAKDPMVRSWVDRSKERIQRLLEEALERREDRAQTLARGGMRVRHSNAAHMAWRSFRDLETVDAPPDLQAQYLAPLLWESSLDTGAEFAYRMRFDYDHTDTWLAKLCDTQVDSIAEQRTRDAALMDALCKPSLSELTKGEIVGRLLAMPAIRKVARSTDLPVLWERLRVTRAVIGQAASGFRSERRLHADYPNALESLAAISGARDARETYSAWLGDGHPIERDEMSRALYRMPWYRWSRTEPSALPPWIELLLNEALAADSPRVDQTASTGGTREDEMRVFVLYTIIANLQAHAPEVLTAELRHRLGKYMETLNARSALVAERWETRRGGYLIEAVLHGTHDSQLDVLCDRWSAVKWEGADEIHYRELRWSLASDTVPDGEDALSGGRVEVRLRALWDATVDDAGWPAIERHYQNNPFDAEPLLRFLTACLRFVPDRRVRTAELLVTCIKTAPMALKGLASVLVPQLWGDRWSALVNLIIGAAGGAHRRMGAAVAGRESGATTEYQVAAISLLRDFVLLQRRCGRPVLDSSTTHMLDAVRTAALLALGDDRALVSNHAAFGVLASAEIVVDDHDAAVLCVALHRIADDTRIAVRTAAAYGGRRLARSARHADVRRVAAEVVEKVVGDPNAMMQCQLALGAIEAEQEPLETAS